MKKRLEADLVSIAHRILQLKNKSDINQLYLETQKLYEKLSVLRFIDEHYGNIKPTIGYAEIEKEIETFYDNTAELPKEVVIEMTESNLPHDIAPEKIIVEDEEVSVTENDTQIEEEISSEETDVEIDAVQLSNEESMIPKEVIVEKAPEKFKAAFELSEQSELEEIPVPKKETPLISFGDLYGSNYTEPLFVKIDEAIPLEKKEQQENNPNNTIENKSETTEPKSVSLNDKLSKGIEIDLNDRIAFVKHLFGNSNEDYNRVLNQLITFDNFYETRNFIQDIVKPDYNNWEGKADYADRFMEIIEKKFL